MIWELGDTGLAVIYIWSATLPKFECFRLEPFRNHCKTHYPFYNFFTSLERAWPYSIVFPMGFRSFKANVHLDRQNVMLEPVFWDEVSDSSMKLLPKLKTELILVPLNQVVYVATIAPDRGVPDRS